MDGLLLTQYGISLRGMSFDRAIALVEQINPVREWFSGRSDTRSQVMKWFNKNTVK